MLRPLNLSRPQRRGIGRAEVLVIVAIVGLASLLFLLSMPGRRENARLIACQRNLGQIGLTLIAYGNAFDGALPTLTTPLPSEPSPVATWLRVLGEPDFSRLVADRPPSIDDAGPAVAAHRVPGLLCPSDPNIRNAQFDAPTSYRLNAGDAPRGLNGPFAPGVFRTLATIEEADGLAFTAAMAERLLGDGQAREYLGNYRRSAGEIGAETGSVAEEWRGDAGSTWAVNGWASNLYNHALTPNAPGSSINGDGQAGLIGASSGHAGRVHVLLLDGRVQSFGSTVHPNIWKALGTVGTPTDKPSAAPEPSPE